MNQIDYLKEINKKLDVLLTRIKEKTPKQDTLTTLQKMLELKESVSVSELREKTGFSLVWCRTIMRKLSKLDKNYFYLVGNTNTESRIYSTKNLSVEDKAIYSILSEVEVGDEVDLFDYCAEEFHQKIRSRLVERGRFLMNQTQKHILKRIKN